MGHRAKLAFAIILGENSSILIVSDVSLAYSRYQIESPFIRIYAPL